MKTQIITDSNGNPCTEIIKPFDDELSIIDRLECEPIKALDKDGFKMLILEKHERNDDYLVMFLHNYQVRRYLASLITHTITTLPALPKHPKPEDAQLLYRYMAEGFNIACKATMNGHLKTTKSYIAENVMVSGFEADCGFLTDHGIEGDYSALEITHCIDSEGNKHDVAIV